MHASLAAANADGTDLWRLSWKLAVKTSVVVVFVLCCLTHLCFHHYTISGWVPESHPNRNLSECRGRILIGLYVWLSAEWLGCWTCYQQVAGSNPSLSAVKYSPGQVVSAHVPLSPSSIIWYQPVGGDALRLGR